MLPYPTTRAEDVEDELAGVRVPDPYRWLEHDTDEVRSWERQQAELATTYIREWPHYDEIRRLVNAYSLPRFQGVPTFAGGRWFRSQLAPGSSQPRAVVATEPFGPGRVLFDPTEENPDRPPFLSWVSPSPDGRVLAIGVCTDGSEQNTVRLIDVSTATRLAGAPSDVLMDNWTGGAHWLEDSTGFFFSAIEGKPADAVHKVFFHALGQDTREVDPGWTTSNDYRMVQVSRDGRYAIAYERLTTPIPVAVAELAAGVADMVWRPFIRTVAGSVHGHVIGDRLMAVTDVDAPRGRVVAIALDNPTPDDPATWLDVIPASDSVLRTLTPVGPALYVSELVDTYSQVRIIDDAGNVRGNVPLPGKGALAELPAPFMMLSLRGHPEQFLFGFSSLIESVGVYRHHPGAPALETLVAPALRLDAEVEDRWARSTDGTLIPYHVVHPRGVPAAVPLPALLYAYGGFNVPLLPQFPGSLAAFVAAGGRYVHAHLRGGGEYGLPWWQGGRMRNKTNCYADLYAVAEDLLEAGLTTSAGLCLTGSSNGGLLAGVAVTQRPELWGAVVPRVPWLDLIGSCRDGYGRYAVEVEIADPTDPHDVARMASFSPYQNVRAQGTYPAVFLDAGDTDPRCPPWHARKFGARLQAEQAGDAPILLRVLQNVGHGWATDQASAIAQNADWLAFAARAVGLTPCASGDAVAGPAITPGAGRGTTR